MGDVYLFEINRSGQQGSSINGGSWQFEFGCLSLICWANEPSDPYDFLQSLDGQVCFLYISLAQRLNLFSFSSFCSAASLCSADAIKSSRIFFSSKAEES